MYLMLLLTLEIFDKNRETRVENSYIDYLNQYKTLAGYDEDA